VSRTAQHELKCSATFNEKEPDMDLDLPPHPNSDEHDGVSAATPTADSEIPSNGLRRQVSSVLIGHTHFIGVRKEIDLVMNLREDAELWNEKDEMPGILLVGFAGAGKSTVLDLVQTDAGPVQRDAITLTDLTYSTTGKADYMPSVRFRMPQEPTVLGVAQLTLKALGDKQWQRGSLVKLSDRVEYYMKVCRPRAFIIDEAHHAVDRSGTYVQEAIADWLKITLDATGTPQILSGLHRLKYLFRHNEQLRRRYNTKIELKHYRCFEERNGVICAVEDQLSNFMGILVAFRAELPVPTDLDFHDEFLARRFYYATGGLIGYVKKILRAAMELLMLEGAVRPLDLPLLAMAYERAVHNDDDGDMRGEINPFTDAYAGQVPGPPRSDSQFGVKRSTRRRLKGKELKARAINALAK
jgi:Bacterial TniB protein